MRFRGLRSRVSGLPVSGALREKTRRTKNWLPGGSSKRIAGFGAFSDIRVPS